MNSPAVSEPLFTAALVTEPGLSLAAVIAPSAIAAEVTASGVSMVVCSNGRGNVGAVIEGGLT